VWHHVLRVAYFSALVSAPAPGTQSPRALLQQTAIKQNKGENNEMAGEQQAFFML